MKQDRIGPSRSPNAVEVRTPARLHLGMLAFGDARSRSFGGVGVMVDRPGVHLRLRRSGRLEARGLHAERAIGFAKACLKAWGLDGAGCSIEVLAAPPGHAGLGSGTQLALAVAAGVRQLHGPPTDADAGPAMPHPDEAELEPSEHDWLFEVRDAMDLARAVGRGRRSCVGVYGFSRGGLIVESGRTMAADAPPDDDATRDFSPMVARVRLPSAWRCVVIVGREAFGLHGDAEKEAFGRLPPMPAEISGELARIALLDLLPAAVEGKFIEFSLAVRKYGALAGKPFEQESRRLPYAQATSQLLELLSELGVPGCAQSSWGPAVMACCESLDAAGRLVDQLDALRMLRHHDVVIARFDGQGAMLRVVD